ncbi:hypothetical protein [Dactylosporangium aurantiacum]|uniref:hypothetical protein n=1 Tax=Dactylosporangium aurantiacum TaxID=35754 RepID=UPI000525A12F|nr:hypothetical protein [Dactylosporangium aurantiacum]MDG6103112.1 hypothetical protein [Dactylosporangium aurantiacum]
MTAGSNEGESTRTFQVWLAGTARPSERAHGTLEELNVFGQHSIDHALFCPEQGKIDALLDDYRQLLLYRDGIRRLYVDPGSGRPLRLAILQVLRQYGATLAESSDTYTRLTGEISLAAVPDRDLHEPHSGLELSARDHRAAIRVHRTHTPPQPEPGPH